MKTKLTKNYKYKYIFRYLLISFIFLLLFLTVYKFDTTDNKYSNIMPANTNDKTNPVSTTPMPTINIDDLRLNKPADWNSYINEAYGFAIAYPDYLRKTDNIWLREKWEYREHAYKSSAEINDGYLYYVGFGPLESVPGGMVWGITVFNDNISVEKVIGNIGNQFKERDEERKNILINGTDAILVTVTTPEDKSWISKNVIIQKDDYIYSISGDDLIEFKDFYNSFLLLQQ